MRPLRRAKAQIRLRCDWHQVQLVYDTQTRIEAHLHLELAGLESARSLAVVAPE